MQRVYLDTNVYCRPRDDRTQKRIDREARALEEIAGLKEERKIMIISSDYVKIELEEIEDQEKREDIRNFEGALCDLNFKHSEKAKTLAKEIMKCNVNLLDALHLSASALAKEEIRNTKL